MAVDPSSANQEFMRLSMKDKLEAIRVEIERLQKYAEYIKQQGEDYGK